MRGLRGWYRGGLVVVQSLDLVLDCSLKGLVRGRWRPLVSRLWAHRLGREGVDLACLCWCHLGPWDAD